MEKRKKGKTIIIIILLLISLGLGGFIIYDKIIKEDPTIKLNKEIKTLKEENKNLVKDDISIPQAPNMKTSAGRYVSISYTENSAFYTEANSLENEGQKLLTKEIDLANQKIQDAKVMDGVISSGADEAVVFIMEDGTVKYAYSYENKVIFENYQPLEGIKVSKINSITFVVGDTSAIVKCDVILKDGTQKNIEKKLS